MQRSTSWWSQALQDRLIALVLAMVVLVPLVATPADLTSRVGIAALAFQGFAVVLAMTLVWRAKFDLRKESVVSFLRTGANLPALAFAGLSAVTCLAFVKNGYGMQAALQTAACVLLYFVIAYQFKRSERIAKLVDTLLFVAIGASAAGFVQFGMSDRAHAVGLFGDHQLFGSFLMILMPICAVLAITEKNSTRQLAAQVATVMTLTGLLLAHSRSAWLGAATGLLVLGVLSLVTLRGKSTRSQMVSRKHEFILPVVLLVASVAFFLLINPVTGDILGRASSFKNLADDQGWNSRTIAWNAANDMFKASPILGHGAGSFALKINQYSSLPSMIGTRPYLGQQAHSFYLQLLAEQGIAGAVLFGGVILSFLVAGVRRVRQMDAGIRRSLLIGTMASVSAFAVDAIASPSWQFGQTSMFLWLAMGLGVSCLRLHSRKNETVEQAPVRTLSPLVARPVAVVGALALAVAIGASLPSAADGGYQTLDSVVISPKPSSIRAGNAIQYTLTAFYSINGSPAGSADVTLDPATTFSTTAAFGGMTGANRSAYQSVSRRAYTGTVTGAYTFSGVTKSDTSALTVTFP